MQIKGARKKKCVPMKTSTKISHQQITLKRKVHDDCSCITKCTIHLRLPHSFIHKPSNIMCVSSVCTPRRVKFACSHTINHSAYLKSKQECYNNHHATSDHTLWCYPTIYRHSQETECHAFAITMSNLVSLLSHLPILTFDESLIPASRNQNEPWEITKIFSSHLNPSQCPAQCKQTMLPDMILKVIVVTRIQHCKNVHHFQPAEDKDGVEKKTSRHKQVVSKKRRVHYSFV